MAYLHKLHNKIYKPLFLHLLAMKVGDKKTNVITLQNELSKRRQTVKRSCLRAHNMMLHCTQYYYLLW